jgi:hypothetical protein
MQYIPDRFRSNTLQMNKLAVNMDQSRPQLPANAAETKPYGEGAERHSFPNVHNGRLSKAIWHATKTAHPEQNDKSLNRHFKPPPRMTFVVPPTLPWEWELLDKKFT